MIIKGKIGLVGFAIFLFVSCMLAWIYEKRTGAEKKIGMVEKIFLIGLVAISLIFGYLVEFKSESIITDVLILFGLMWLFSGLIILSIRARRRRRG